MVVCAPRAVLSSPAVPRVASAVTTSRHERLVRKTIPLAQHSSSFVTTQIVLPVVDITCDYNSYRYKNLEENLRRRYGANYPPGKVVLNYIQLSTPDSRNALEDIASDDFLDLLEENDAGAYWSVSTRLESEYLNLLDHFVSKQQEKARTAGKFTETLSVTSAEKNLVASSYDGTWSQSTLRSSVTQEKEPKSCGNQRSMKGTEYEWLLIFNRLLHGALLRIQ